MEDISYQKINHNQLEPSLTLKETPLLQEYKHQDLDLTDCHQISGIMNRKMQRILQLQDPALLLELQW